MQIDYTEVLVSLLVLAQFYFLNLIFVLFPQNSFLHITPFLFI